MDRIVFLGTAGSREVVAKQFRYSGGILIQSGDNQFLLDPGPGSVVRALQAGINLREITALLVSHNHLGHVNDVNAMIDAITLAGQDTKSVMLASESVFEGYEGCPAVLADFYKNQLERAIALEPEQKVGINDVEIHTLRTKHTDPSAIGFKILAPNFSVAYSSDTKYFREMEDDYKDIDVLILNVQDPPGIKSACLNVEDAAKIIEKIMPKLAIITHFGLKLLKHDPIAAARDLQRQTGCQVIAAKDGMSLSPSTFAASTRQQKLNLFESEKKE